MRKDFKQTKTIMVQGTTSDAGKSILVTGICRLLNNQGKVVAPFKPQNMALNSAVTIDGGEIGRSQAVQAQAARLKPHSDFNPILLKPSSDTGAQVIIHGKANNHMDATGFHDFKKVAMQAVLESYDRLNAEYDYIIVEGAGSPAEINLRENDIANMGFAEAVDCPVILIADIDRGGVFAHLVGTLDLLSKTEQERVIGFVINRFRGDIALLKPGLDWLEKKTGKPVLGVLPYLNNFYLDAEDAICTQQKEPNDKLNIIVPVLPRISNHTDFDALRLHPEVNLQFINIEQTPPVADLIILPGSKNVRADLSKLKAADWQKHIHKHLRYGGKLIGICGGYQMLGNTIDDPDGIEDKQGSTDGFALLNVSTTLFAEKQLNNISGKLIHPEFNNTTISGYEIHCGETSIQEQATELPLIEIDDATPRFEGLCSEDNQIMGTYLHGLFDQRDACNAILKWAGLDTANSVDLNSIREQQLDRLAKMLTENLVLDLDKPFI